MDGDLAQAMEFLRLIGCRWMLLAYSSKIDSFTTAPVYTIVSERIINVTAGRRGLSRTGLILDSDVDKGP